MGVLGIIIQTEFGLPLYIEMFDPKLEKFQQMDMSLTAGFITAINMFTKQYDMTLGHIKLHKNKEDVYGVNLIATKMGEYLILCFVDPFTYHEIVREKIGWIYSRVLQKGSNITPERLRFDFSHTANLTDEEKVWIADTLQDLYLKAMLAANKENIDSLLGKFFLKYVGIHGISINSFDNSILYFSGINEEIFRLVLNNIGRRSSIIKENETVDSYVSIPSYPPVRVYAVNSGIKFQIQDIMTNLPEKIVSLYYYLIVDPDLNVRPIIVDLIEILDPFFSNLNDV
ncbi:MAG: hypothetical protein ACFFD2_29745 [Promethearchaeota archaeon]